MHTDTQPRILILDIETSPATAYVWKRWEEDIRPEQVVEESFVLCAVGQFLNDRRVEATNACDDAGHPVTSIAGLHDDRDTVLQVWRWLNEADIVVAHNGKKFDLPVLNARFLKHGLPPPSPYKIVDTCAAAKRYFKLPYNGLDAIAAHLNLGRKKPTGGLQLWKDCLQGDLKAWDRMLKYCRQDVALLGRVYRRMRPYIGNHPNVSAYSGHLACSKCQSTRVQRRGLQVSRSRSYARYQCQDCGAWGQSPTSTGTPAVMQPVPG